MDRPVPPFYCVYMLRSTVTKLKYFYIGSTPNPRRRLRQHNGEIQGGAARTADARRRPWEMAVIISGFPSKIAALQFEWSLQNTHLTRHVRGADKDTLTTGRKRPPATLNKKLQDLHILLRANSFARWPLQVHFFAEDAYKHWQSKTLAQSPFSIPAYIKVLYDGNSNTGASNCLAEGSRDSMATGINAFDVTYGSILDHVLKSHHLISQSQNVDCTVCRSSMHAQGDLFVVCPNNACDMTAHLTCLTGRFSGAEGTTGPLLPVQGQCPSCSTPLSWADLAKEASLRARGRPIVEALLKPTATSKKRGAATIPVTGLEDDDQGSESEQEHNMAIAGLVPDAQEEPRTKRKPKPKKTTSKKATKSAATVVPDSDTDDIDDLSV